MISRDKIRPGKEVSQGQNVEQLIKRLDMLDERLDNIDSIVTSIIEKVMGRPLVMEVRCPNCGQTIQINITSGVRVRGKE